MRLNKPFGHSRVGLAGIQPNAKRLFGLPYQWFTVRFAPHWISACAGMTEVLF